MPITYHDKKEEIQQQTGEDRRDHDLRDYQNYLADCRRDT
jgi:hypothetical protein